MRRDRGREAPLRLSARVPCGCGARAGAVNRKRVYRLYREAGLAVRRRKRKRIGPFERKPLPEADGART